MIEIQFKEEASPVIQAQRRIPLHFVHSLRDHLRKVMEEDVVEGALTGEEEGTCISNLVITVKSKTW